SQMNTKNTRNISFRQDERVVLTGDTLDPFTDEHDIEYWLWDGERLIPASAEECERFREREAQLRLGYWTSLSEGNDLAQPAHGHGIVSAAQSMSGRLLTYISNSSRRTS
ncbi:MAG: hypothetical protein ACXWQZ_22680, partial [Ktedonobacterales bacterium]